MAATQSLHPVWSFAFATAATKICTILICFLFQYLTMFVDDFNFEVFEQFMQHLSLCADSYRAASNREQRRIVLTNLFISCDHSGVSQPSKVFRLRAWYFAVWFVPISLVSPQKSFTKGLLILKKSKIRDLKQTEFFFFLWNSIQDSYLPYLVFFFIFSYCHQC